jgi:hypothetical protein
MRIATVGLAALLSLTALAGLSTGQIIGGDLLNSAPVIQSVTIDDLDGTVDPSAGGTRNVVATATITDANGFLDILALTGTTMALVFGGNDVIAEAAAPRTSGSLLSGTYQRTFAVPYYFAPGTYTIRVEVTDLALATDVDTSRTFTYSTLLAADPGGSVDLGSSLSPGSAGSIVALAVENTGNAVIDVQVLAAGALEHATEDASIAASSVEYGVASDLTGASTLVTSSPPTLTAFSLAVATSGGASSDDVYFRLNVPSVADSPDGYLPAGEYQTTVTITAVANS